MKKHFWIQLAVLGAALAGSGAAQAGNEGPSAAPSVPARLMIAELRVVGAFAPPPGIDTGVRIYADGVVESFDHAETRALALLSADLAQDLTSLSHAAQVRELIDDQPGRPGCLDAPVVTYKLYNANGEAVTIGKRAACHNFSREDAYGSNIRALLDAFARIRF